MTMDYRWAKRKKSEPHKQGSEDLTNVTHLKFHNDAVCPIPVWGGTAAIKTMRVVLYMCRKV